MAKLERQENSLTYYFGWYGSCTDDSSCADFSLNESAEVYNHIYKVFQINRFGDNYSIFDGTYDFEDSAMQTFQDFSNLSCGKAYLIVLNEGEGFLNIDNFTYTNDSTASFGGLLRNSCVDANPPTTTELKQAPGSLSFYMGWYGVCSECSESYDLTIEGRREKIFRVFQINERNENYSVFLPSYTPDQDFMQDFTKLECGRAYLIVLNRGEDTLDDLTDFVATNKLSTASGFLVNDCSAETGNNLNSPRVALISKNINEENMIWFDSSDVPTVNGIMHNVTKDCPNSDPVPTETRTPTLTPSYTEPVPTETRTPTPVEEEPNNEELDFTALITEFSNLAEQERKMTTTEIIGVITEESISGGFYGVVVSDDESETIQEKYLPINIQEDLSEYVGKKIKISQGYSKLDDGVSIFMWGTMIYCEEWEIIDDEIVFPTTICFSTSGPNGETFGKYELFDEETVSQKFSDAGYNYQAIIDAGINGDKDIVNWMTNQDSLVKYYHILDENIENDWWDFIYWDGTKDDGEWQRYDQYIFSDTYDLLNPDGYKFTGGNDGIVPEIFISDISDGQDCVPDLTDG